MEYYPTMKENELLKTSKTLFLTKLERSGLIVNILYNAIYMKYF